MDMFCSAMKDLEDDTLLSQSIRKRTCEKNNKPRYTTVAELEEAAQEQAKEEVTRLRAKHPEAAIHAFTVGWPLLVTAVDVSDV